MKVIYKKQFIKDLSKLKGTQVSKRIKTLVFEVLPNANSLFDVSSHIKLLKGTDNKFRIRIADYRIGLEVKGNVVEVVRVLHRKEFYRFYP